MNNSDVSKSSDMTEGTVGKTAVASDAMSVHGTFTAVCRDKDGNIKWEDTVKNLVTTLGKNLLLDTTLAGSAYTVVGPYMGLISSVSYTTGPAAGDTMTSHAGWTEAGGANAPTYTTRKTISWSAASGGVKASSSVPVFTFTGAGTVKGSFIVTGSGALATVDNTAGTLYCAGLFSGGDKTVAASDTLTLTYSGTLT